jgi:hypothetical protein
VYVKVTVVDPPQADGAPVLLLVKPPLQPPLAVAVANQVAKAVFTAACVWQAAVVVFVGQVKTTGGAVGTVNVAWQVVVSGAQLLVYVKVTVVDPPQAAGAPVLLLVKPPLQPPLAVAVANQVAKAVFTAACVWQAAAVVFVGQVKTTGGAVGTVNVAWQVVVVGAQVLVYVKVTVVDPPHAEGAPVLLLVKPPLQPPLAVAVANQVAKAVFTAACVWQAAVVVFIGQVSTTVGDAGTVNVAWQVVVSGAQVLV